MPVYRTIALSALLSIAPATLLAQVGHDPARSPYHDIRPTTSWELFGGRIGGDGGPIPVGPRDGSYGGIRILLRARSTISLGFSFWGALTERNVLDPDKSPAERQVGTRDAHLLGGELVIQFNPMGGKRWHSISPFVGTGLGLARNLSGDADDPGQYEFGSRFYFAPMVGARFFVADKLYLRAEARGYVWKIPYPVSYSLEPSGDPGTRNDPHALNPLNRSGQLIVTPALSLGIGFSF